MIVRELIQFLQEQDPDMEIVTYDDGIMYDRVDPRVREICESEGPYHKWGWLTEADTHDNKRNIRKAVIL